jgi:hypothetical protein
MENLAVLCFMCHGETHTYGGFCRRLDSAQIALYRDEWVAEVGRAKTDGKTISANISDEAKAAVAARLLASGRLDLLARHFHLLRRYDLRDLYAERAIKEMPLNMAQVIELRLLQEQAEKIPAEYMDAFLQTVRDRDGLSQLARWQRKLGKHREAIVTYCELISLQVQTGDLFSAALSLRELTCADLQAVLLHESYKTHCEAHDLWRAVRCLQELEWSSELERLLALHEEEIRSSSNRLLQFELFRISGDEAGLNQSYVSMYDELLKEPSRQPALSAQSSTSSCS